MQKLVVGLGNPGSHYAKTRHNMGFLVLGALVKSLGWELKKDRDYRAYVARGQWKEQEIHLLLPQTYMNLSGESVGKYMRYYHFEPNAMLVVLDDVALPFKKIRLKGVGSSGGHNGLKSIEQHIGTQAYARLRMGVGDRQYGSLSDHVLGVFSENEKAELEEFLHEGVQAIETWLTTDLTRAMMRVNQTKETSKEENGEDGRREEKPL